MPKQGRPSGVPLAQKLGTTDLRNEHREFHVSPTWLHIGSLEEL